MTLVQLGQDKKHHNTMTDINGLFTQQYQQ